MNNSDDLKAMRTLKVMSAEYGPDNHNGDLKLYPSKGHSRIVEAYGMCPKCEHPTPSVLVRVSKCFAECEECGAYASLTEAQLPNGQAVDYFEIEWQ